MMVMTDNAWVILDTTRDPRCYQNYKHFATWVDSAATNEIKLLPVPSIMQRSHHRRSSIRHPILHPHPKRLSPQIIRHELPRPQLILILRAIPILTRRLRHKIHSTSQLINSSNHLTHSRPRLINLRPHLGQIRVLREKQRLRFVYQYQEVVKTGEERILTPHPPLDPSLRVRKRTPFVPNKLHLLRKVK